MAEQMMGQHMMPGGSMMQGEMHGEKPQEKRALGRHKTDEDLVKWIHEQMKIAKSDTTDWRTDAEEDYGFYASEQWSTEDRAALEEQQRPVITFNRVARTINAISGLEVQNRQEVRFVPRETDDSRLAEYYSAVVKWARDQCDAEDEDSEAFQDALICGLGATQTRLDYEEDQEGMIKVDRFDPLEAFWDCSARKRNLTDRKWNARVKKYTSADDVRATWANYVGGQSSGEQYLEDYSKKAENASPPHYTGEESSSAPKKPVEVICFNWYEPETVYRVLDDAGELVTLSELKYRKLADQIEAAQLRVVKQKKRCYYIAYVAGNELLDAQKAPVQDGFMLNFITGLRDRNNNAWFGLVRLMIDPQRWANKWLSQILHIMNSNSKGGLLAEKDAFENSKKAEKEWADPTAITFLKNGAIAQGKVQQKQIVQFPAGFAQLMQYAVEAISDTPGVNSELLGLAERDQPAVLEVTRKQAGVVMLGVFFDSLRRYRKQQGRVLATLVRDFIADGRKIRIIGQEGKPEVVAIMRDAMSFTYDIVVDDAPNSPSMKDRTFTILQALVPQLLQAGIPIPPEILDYSPLPTGLVEKWKAMLTEPNPEQEKAKQLDSAEKVAEIQKDQTQAELNKAKAEQLGADAIGKVVKAEQEKFDTFAKQYWLQRGVPPKIQ
ncbi:MAG TPA: phage portal protein [Candidatus Binatia bacterium]|nr:phage portal protein [Candidatus Binatia bacterium]